MTLWGRQIGVAVCAVVGLVSVGAHAGPCGPGNGDCFSANGSPGCEDVCCCVAVCAVDPFCCDQEWDTICANNASNLCLPDCVLLSEAWAIEVDGLGSDERLVIYDPTSPTLIAERGPLTGLTATQFATGLAWTPDWELWMTAVDINDDSSELHRLDPATGGTIFEMPIIGMGLGESASDLAYDPNTNHMLLLTVSGNSSRVRRLNLDTGNAIVVVSPVFPGTYLGLAVTSDGHHYLENISTNTVQHLDASFSFVNSLPLGFDAAFNQGMGTHWSVSDVLVLAGLDASVPATDGAVSYTFQPDLTGYTFHGIIGGAGTAQELGDVTYRPDCTGPGCDDGNGCTDDLCQPDGSCVFVNSVQGQPCELDGDLCTIDICDGQGACVNFGPVFCPGPDPPCEGGQECNPDTGLCEDLPDAPFPTICEADGDLCTVDSCDGMGGCILLGELKCGEGEVCNPATGDCEPDPSFCPWDCGDGNGVIDTIDFLALLAEWGLVDTPCDFDGGGVDTVDFLKLLANWGVCGLAIAPGEDCWTTDCGNGTLWDFGGTPLPADFFEPGSDPFDSPVEFGGQVPDGVDTRIARIEELLLDDIGSMATVDIQLVQLDLVGCQPIVVTVNGGQDPEEWDVAMGLSGPQPGEMNVQRTHPGGGDYTATILVQPVFVFTKVSDPGQVLIFDTGLEGFPPAEMQSIGPAPWVSDLDPNLFLPGCGTPSFTPGIVGPVSSQCAEIDSFDDAVHQFYSHNMRRPQAPVCDP